jgi:hypothetical protein
MTTPLIKTMNVIVETPDEFGLGPVEVEVEVSGNKYEATYIFGHDLSEHWKDVVYERAEEKARSMVEALAATNALALKHCPECGHT